MPADPSELPVVVTFREVEKVLTGQEAVGNLREAANSDATASPAERAAVMAAVGNVLNELRRAEREAGARVLTTPQHGPASRLQSLIASGEAADLKFERLPSGGLEAKFDTHDWFGWATVAWAKLKHLVPHAMLRPASAVPEPFPAAGRVALLGDWGTGLYGAPEIAASIRRDRDPIALLLHLGDVYYSGTEKEVRQRFLDVWPFRSEATSRALNSNHEMYSGGDAYFDVTLPRFGQTASYFAYQNQHWTLVGLDVAYIDHAIDDRQVEWLKQVIRQAGDRKLVLFSHHQLYSHFEATPGSERSSAANASSPGTGATSTAARCSSSRTRISDCGAAASATAECRKAVTRPAVCPARPSRPTSARIGGAARHR
jgi:hypothetical protein